MYIPHTGMLCAKHTFFLSLFLFLSFKNIKNLGKIVICKFGASACKTCIHNGVIENTSTSKVSGGRKAIMWCIQKQSMVSARDLSARSADGETGYGRTRSRRGTEPETRMLRIFLFFIPSPCFSAVYFYQRGQIRIFFLYSTTFSFFLQWIYNSIGLNRG